MSDSGEQAVTGDAGGGFELTSQHRKLLLEVARNAIIDAAKHRPIARPPAPPEGDSVLGSNAGVFVTLHGPEHSLRGCIGYIEGEHSLLLTVALAAEAAATRDTRFSPLREEELDEINLSISVLTPAEEIDDPASVQPGVHGLIIQRGMSRGLLLPQVATERGWDRETFLDHTCLKAGLPPKAWREEGTRISVFTAVVFSEQDEL